MSLQDKAARAAKDYVTNGYVHEDALAVTLAQEDYTAGFIDGYAHSEQQLLDIRALLKEAGIVARQNSEYNAEAMIWSILEKL